MRATTSKPDRRVQRTRELLLDALFDLMIKRGYERLTIQNLLDRSGVGRATFYAHFKSKDDLLASSVARLRGTLERAWQTRPGQRMGFTLPLFQHMASHRRIYLMTVVPESEVSVQQHFRRMLRDLVRDDLATRRSARRDDASVDLATHYVVGALWSTIVWWMDSASSMPPERVNAVFQRLTFPGLDVTLGEAT
jgi:AcrR family transcriptional regulator